MTKYDSYRVSVPLTLFSALPIFQTNFQNLVFFSIFHLQKQLCEGIVHMLETEVSISELTLQIIVRTKPEGLKSKTLAIF